VNADPDDVEVARCCAAAVAVVATCRSGAALTVRDVVGDVSLPWVVVALGHLAAGLLATLPDAEAEAWLQGKGLRVAVDLAALERTAADRAREAT
jgi:hypothetical protein